MPSHLASPAPSKRCALSTALQKDNSGGTVSGVTVKVRDLATNCTRTTTAKEDGSPIAAGTTIPAQAAPAGSGFIQGTLGSARLIQMALHLAFQNLTKALSYERGRRWLSWLLRLFSLRPAAAVDCGVLRAILAGAPGLSFTARIASN